MKLEEWTFRLSTDETAKAVYDLDSDLLEIFFQSGEATCAVELTESIILRFDWETGKPLSLSLISASQSTRHTEYGEIHFELPMDEWPDEVRNKVWVMLRVPPLSDFLKLGSYVPA